MDGCNRLIAGPGVAWRPRVGCDPRWGAQHHRDNDGIAAGDDACPFENPDGVDANGDGYLDRIEDLPAEIISLGLQQGIGIENSLLQKVENALTVLVKDEIAEP